MQSTELLVCLCQLNLCYELEPTSISESLTVPLTKSLGTEMYQMLSIYLNLRGKKKKKKLRGSFKSFLPCPCFCLEQVHGIYVLYPVREKEMETWYLQHCTIGLTLPLKKLIYGENLVTCYCCLHFKILCYFLMD